MPSCTCDKGSKLKGKIENLCSSDDNCWNRHPPVRFLHMPQLMMRDCKPLCSIRTRRSPGANRSSTPGTYSLIKWFGETSAFGIQTSPTLGMLVCCSANSGLTLHKVGSEIEIGLEFGGACPPPVSIDYLQPHSCSSEVPTVGNFHYNIPRPCLIGIYADQPDYSKS